jgi:hypothetical protein
VPLQKTDLFLDVPLTLWNKGRDFAFSESELVSMFLIFFGTPFVQAGYSAMSFKPQEEEVCVSNFAAQVGSFLSNNSLPC